MTWKGCTDLKCVRGTSTEINSATATLEMKVPFNSHDPRLYHSTAIQPKQQLLGYAMGLLRSHKRIDNLSYLTDCFALSVMYHVEGKAWLSKRVIDAKAFCLRILLMCCDLSTDEWRCLIPADSDCVDIGDDEDDEASSTSSKPTPTLLG